MPYQLRTENEFIFTHTAGSQPQHKTPHKFRGQIFKLTVEVDSGSNKGSLKNLENWHRVQWSYAAKLECENCHYPLVKVHCSVTPQQSSWTAKRAQKSSLILILNLGMEFDQELRMCSQSPPLSLGLAWVWGKQLAEIRLK